MSAAASSTATATGPEVRHLVLELLALKDVQLVQDELQALRVERTVLVQVPTCKNKRSAANSGSGQVPMKLLHERSGGREKRNAPAWGKMRL
jgi:hypothetical protein